MFAWSEHKRSGSFSSDDSQPLETDRPVPPPVLVYHESARSIVFRDHLRRARSTYSRESSMVSDTGSEPVQQMMDRSSHSLKNSRHSRKAKTPLSLSRKSSAASDSSDNEDNIKIANFQPDVDPLPALQLTANDQFAPLLADIVYGDLTIAEREVVGMLESQRACVKTLKNSDWTPFLRRFWKPQHKHHGLKFPDVHDDIAPHGDYIYNSFVTSTSLLPPGGRKMRAYGSAKEYTVGVVFALPESYGSETEEDVVKRTQTWAWPAGYAAKTEFNIDGRGRLINGREEVLVTLDKMRENNLEYINSTDYKILGREVKGGLQTVPYNEIFLRVGGLGRIVNGKDVASHEERIDEKGTGRSLDNGVGLPVAFFVRTVSYGHLITLLRTKARAAHVFGEEAMDNIPLLYMTPESGVRVLTSTMQEELLKIAARDLNPFQNVAVAYRTTIDNTHAEQMEQKMEELLDLDSEIMRKTLTPEERGRIAGGFGATDESTVSLFMEAKRKDSSSDSGDSSKGMHVPDDHHHHLQDIVNDGLEAAVRSSDYHTARQLLILYTLVATKGEEIDAHHKAHLQEKAESEDEEADDDDDNDDDSFAGAIVSSEGRAVGMDTKSIRFCDSVVRTDENGALKPHDIPPPPPPPPLDTDRLRSATSSDGLLAVLGAAQVLRAMQDGGARKRVLECIDAINEWVQHGENSIAFRLASWRDQHAAQNDLKIAMKNDSSVMAFVSSKAITNRKKFALQLKDAVSTTNFQCVEFLQAIHDMLSKMHSPCLRLELLQFVLGLDNRFSVAHLKRSIQLAATCLSVTTHPVPTKKQLEASLPH